MIRQKSFENEKPTLYLVATPIGNLSELSPRAADILRNVNVIACEDTRTSGQMLKHFDIHNRLISYQNFNEDPSARGIINLLSQGQNVALISDAGYPLINDPGQRVVTEASALGFNVVPVSGSSAVLNALVASGLVVQPFLFVGFLPSADNERNRRLREFRSYPMTMVFYESPHRIKKCLKSCLEIFGDRRCVLARELTKVHEEFIRGTVKEIYEIADDLKGEMVIVMEGNKDDYPKDVDYGTLITMVSEKVAAGISRSDAIKDVASVTGISRRRLYELVHSKDN
ncbi:MAG: 16S rRNA (cytidine(1402)-2'-O)-methyltransferase [Solobacterium sp.]|nr:16S rRNA (cytidine(1402)-2'-O)-methyltransferase [Solobacterium sp.]MBR2769810.1 16S rRNA (cytidine(1402)-2'-O)-methyltransferase [Solobacterium sp.]MBR2793081.1 16S rRNA (cytidine(1402)-2'-O)-methyltransferase [Solobacterium sp.]